MGLLAAGALDGEVAYLAGTITKQTLFGGGAAAVMGNSAATPESFAENDSGPARIAWEAYIESAVKAIAALRVSAPTASEVVLSGRMARVARVRTEIARRLETAAPDMVVHALRGFASTAKQAAQGAALIADGLSGGAEADLVTALAIEAASGTVLDYLALIPSSVARARLGIVDA